MSRPEAIIFDLGGTLATPEDWTGAVRRSLSRMGLPTDEAEAWVARASESVGHPEGSKTSRTRLRRHRDAWARAVLEAAGVSSGLAARTALLRRLVETEILWREPYPEVSTTLDRLVEEGYRIAVASNNDGRTREKVAAIGLTHPFEAIVDSVEERTAKPAPDLVARAAEILDVMPYRCMYVGDRPEMDVVAGHAASMPVAWVDRHGVGPGDWRAEIHLPDLSRLPEAIAETLA
jgi:HAD superfamily hydrolase (TIGR01662 family)